MTAGVLGNVCEHLHINLSMSNTKEKFIPSLIEHTGLKHDLARSALGSVLP